MLITIPFLASNTDSLLAFCATDWSCSRSAADRQVSPEQLERLRELALEKQKEGAAPLPVVRLCFVGRGRAGKTTTLRRLRGEAFRDEEPSTHGLDVWAGQAEAHLQADGSAAGPWKEWKNSMHHTAVKDAYTCALHTVTQ